MSGAASLREELARARPFPSAQEAAVSAALETLIASASAAHPELLTDAAAFARFAGERLPAEGTVAEGLASFAAEDLLLTWSCLAGNARAVEKLDQLLRRVTQALRRTTQFRSLGDELEQVIRQKLLVGTPPKLAQYAGRGALAGWLRAVATRTAIDLTRGAKNRPTDDEREESALASPDPELLFIRGQYQKPFRAAFRGALAALAAEQRTLLRLAFVDGVAHEQIARLHKVHQTTVTRRIAAALEQLQELIRAELARQMKIAPRELESLIRAIGSELEVSLSGLLPSERR